MKRRADRVEKTLKHAAKTASFAAMRGRPVAARGGCHDCHTHQSCQAHCPTGLNPTASIASLKRRTVTAWIAGEIGR